VLFPELGVGVTEGVSIWDVGDFSSLVAGDVTGDALQPIIGNKHRDSTIGISKYFLLNSMIIIEIGSLSW
jgi:hypothetical protein